MAHNVVTRFAPSPTGFLHIGGARTALFNWLFARHHGGKMLLRIEDTDRARSTPEAIDAILDGLSWLGITWDEEPFYQFERAERHREVAETLLANGKAYKCFATQEELEAMREEARKNNLPPRYNGLWRDRDTSQAPEGAPYVIRIKGPQQGETIVEDKVQGTVTFPNKDLDDLVLLRSDGTPTYMLAVVVDDHDMGVTHAIRGDDHLTNAARQSIIYKAMGWEPPVFAHIPLIHGPDGAKLSKRHGALGADAYRAMGYLPEAMRNYLIRLGWSHGDEEIFSTEQAIKWFGLESVGKSPARFDIQKLENLNGHYMRSLDDDIIMQNLEVSLPYLDGGKEIMKKLDPETKIKLKEALPGLKERAKTLQELIDNAAYIYTPRPLPMNEKALSLLTIEARGRLQELKMDLSDVSEWTLEALEACVKDFASKHDMKLGKIAQPMRAALTGTASSPGIYDVMITLGREETLERLADCGQE
jgi:glutamyl-tRNA synthetase